MPRIATGSQEGSPPAIPTEYRLREGRDEDRLNSIGQASLRSALSTGTQIDSQRVARVVSADIYKVEMPVSALTTEATTNGTTTGGQKTRTKQTDVILQTATLDTVTLGGDANIITQLTATGKLGGDVNITGSLTGTKITYTVPKQKDDSIISYAPIVQVPKHGGLQE